MADFMCISQEVQLPRFLAHKLHIVTSSKLEIQKYFNANEVSITEVLRERNALFKEHRHIPRPLNFVAISDTKLIDRKIYYRGVMFDGYGIQYRNIEDRSSTRRNFTYGGTSKRSKDSLQAELLAYLEANKTIYNILVNTANNIMWDKIEVVAAIELATLVSSIHTLHASKPEIWRAALAKHAYQVEAYKNKYGITPTPARS